MSSICLNTKQFNMSLRLLLSRCFAVGTQLANVRPLCEHPKGYITQKFQFTRGPAGGERKNQQCVCASCLLWKHQSGIKRGLWFQARPQSDHEALSLAEYRDRSWLNTHIQSTRNTSVNISTCNITPGQRRSPRRATPEREQGPGGREGGRVGARESERAGAK